MTARSDAYRQRLLKAGGQIVAVRMTAEQLQTLDRCRLKRSDAPESRSACVNRILADHARRAVDDQP